MRAWSYSSKIARYRAGISGMQKRTLLLVAPYFPPSTGGLERYVFKLGESLQRLGWRVVVITTSEDTSVKETVEGMTVYRLPYQFKVSNTPFSFRWLSQIRRIVRAEKPDIVNVHTPVPGIGDIAALVARRVPLVVTYHSGSMWKGRWWIDTIVAMYELFVLPLLLWKAVHVISASDAVRFGFLKKYAYKSSTLSPAIHNELFQPTETLPQEPRILFVTAKLSRAYAHKGFPILLRALATLHARGIPATLDVIGDGDMREAYTAEVQKMGLATFVRFRGKLLGEELAAAYREASLFVLPTSNDSYPVSVLEALASGLPIISTHVGDIPKMVTEGETGFLVDQRDEQALVEKMALLLTDYPRRALMGKKARASILTNFNWDDRARAMNAILKRALAPRIVHACGYYPPHVGGIERMVSTAARMLSERGHAVTVITSGGPSIERSDGLVVRKLASVEFAHTPFAPTLPWHLLTLPRQSILHIHLAQAYWPDMVRIAARVRGIPYIAHYHLDVEPSGFFGSLFIWYKRFTWGPLLCGATRVVACSEAQKEWIHASHEVEAEKISVIPNAVADSFFAQEHEPPRERIRLLSIGRLTNQKRIDCLIDACALLTIPYHLTIAGDGEDRPALEAQAKEKGVSVSFIGNQDDAHMQELHRTHDAFLISSGREGGTPLVVLEAFAGGLPVIAANVSGVRELVHETGILVEPSPENFAKAIEHLFNNPEHYRELSQKGIEKAKSHTWQRYIDQLEDMYFKCAGLACTRDRKV